MTAPPPDGRTPWQVAKPKVIVAVLVVVLAVYLGLALDRARILFRTGDTVLLSPPRALPDAGFHRLPFRRPSLR